MEGPFGCSPRKRPPLINITPLVDVTLLLLIFFMVTATFREMRALDIQVPRAESGVVMPVSVSEIAIDDQGALTYNASPVTPDELRILLRDLAAADEDAEVALRADKRVTYEAVARVLDMARLAGLTQITLPVTAQE